eukprot:2059113-Rhodomonas_salina.1
MMQKTLMRSSCERNRQNTMPGATASEQRKVRERKSDQQRLKPPPLFIYRYLYVKSLKSYFRFAEE